MIEIKITGTTPIETLASVAAFGIRCLSNDDVRKAADRIYESELTQEAKNEMKAELPAAPAQPAPTTAPPVATPQPVAAAPAPAPVPLAAAPTYTLEQLARAGADLVTREPAKGPAAQGLLKQFGVETVGALPKERYGEFATALRGLGAAI